MHALAPKRSGSPLQKTGWDELSAHYTLLNKEIDKGEKVSIKRERNQLK